MPVTCLNGILLVLNLTARHFVQNLENINTQKCETKIIHQTYPGYPLKIFTSCAITLLHKKLFGCIVMCHNFVLFTGVY